MESITYSKNLKISPKKLRFLLPEIKKLKPVDVLDYLMYTPRKSAAIFYKVMKSALTDAKNFLKVDEKMLRFKHLSVEEGQKLKRFRPGGRGTTKPILRRFGHLNFLKNMGQKVHPKGLRLGIIFNWSSRWFFSNKKTYRETLISDSRIRTLLLKKLSFTSVTQVDIERAINKITLIIHSVMHGMIIGRGGKGLEEIKKFILSYLAFDKK